MNLSKPFLIAGPCALESEAIAMQIAAELKTISINLRIPVVFKGSYTKANRTKEDGFHGLGLTEGLKILSMVKQQYSLPVTSDVHDVDEVEKAAAVLDVIQIPALLCKNTAILHAVGETGKWVNIKKGHFITADDLLHSVEKIEARGNHNIMVTERGNLFGYGEIIVDFRNLGTMNSWGYPVIYDASHSVRNIARRAAEANGGTPQHIPQLVRCAAISGVDGLFIETHPDPRHALCDASVSYPLQDLPSLVRSFKRISEFNSEHSPNE